MTVVAARMSGSDVEADSCASLSARSQQVVEWSTAFLVVLLPFTLPFYVVLDRSAQPGADSLVFFPADLGLTVLVGVGLPIVVRKVRRRQLGYPGLLLTVFTVLTFVAALANPEPEAFQFGFRVGAVTIVVLVLSELGPRLLGGPIMCAFVLVGIEQSALAVGQSALGRPLGLTVLGLGELPSLGLPLSGGLPWVRGTLFYPYMLAGFAVLFATVVLSGALLRQRRRLYLALTAIVAVPIGLTYSRMSVLAVLAIGIVLSTGRRRRRRNLAGLAAFLIGVLVPAVCRLDGWIARQQMTADATGVDGISSGRLTLVRQAWELIESAPVFGVGPANYVDVLARRDPTIEWVQPVHNVPLLAAAEGGVLSGLVLTFLLLSLGAVVLRSGVASRAIYCGLMPFFLLDVIPYRTPQGIVMFGLWAGALLGVSRSEMIADAAMTDVDRPARTLKTSVSRRSWTSDPENNPPRSQSSVQRELGSPPS